MEKRFVIFIIITFLVMGIYPFIIEKLGLAPPPLIVQPTTSEPEPSSPGESRPSRDPFSSEERAEEREGDTPESLEVFNDPFGATRESLALKPAAKEERITIETPLYRARFSSKGAELVLWELKEYTEEDRETRIVLFSGGGGVSPGFSVTTGDAEIDSILADGNYTVLGPRNIKVKDGQTKEVVFRFQDPGSGVFLSKRFTFNGDTYKIGVELETEGLRQVQFNLGTDFGITDWGDPKKGFIGFIGPVSFFDEEIVKDKPGKIGDGVRHKGSVGWTSLQDKYFISAAIPKTPATAVVFRPTEDTVSAGLDFALQGRGIKTTRLNVYAGPKAHDRLKSHNVSLEKSIDFGLFFGSSWSVVRFIAEPLFYVLRFFYGYTGNFGVAIILLTVCVKILFIPLTHKAYRSMKNMQLLAPQLKVLQAKHKDDKQKLQKEMLSLYQDNKVNPLGGCLPMLLQIPVFVGLFNVLYTTIEIRQAPFYFWIQDLSMKDPIYVLPVIMGVSMFLQQKMQPVTMEGAQAKIMMMMPFFITFLFLSFPSGLVLYMVTNNILTIGQQYFTMNFLDEKPKPPKEPSQAAPSPAGSEKQIESPDEEPKRRGGGKKSRPSKRPRKSRR